MTTNGATGGGQGTSGYKINYDNAYHDAKELVAIAGVLREDLNDLETMYLDGIQSDLIGIDDLEHIFSQIDYRARDRVRYLRDLANRLDQIAESIKKVADTYKASEQAGAK